MMTLFEDVRLGLREICQTFGLSGTAATVIPLVVLGAALNIAALSAVRSVHHERRSACGHAVLRSAAQTEIKVVRAMVTSTLKKIGDGQRRWCLTQQRMRDRQTEMTGYHVEVGFVWTTPVSNEPCDLKVLDNPNRKMAIAFVKC
jgi:hypothetical protein